MVVCCVKNCKSAKGMPSGKGKSFHVFPRHNSKQYATWMQLIGKKEWLNDRKYRVVCSDHFQEKDFDRTGQTVRLRAGTVPTLLLPPQFSVLREHNYFKTDIIDYILTDVELRLSPQQESTSSNEILQEYDVRLESHVKIESDLSNQVFNTGDTTDANSSITDQLTTAKKRKLIISEHSYHIAESPKELKMKLFSQMEKTQRVARRLKTVAQKLRRLQKRLSAVEGSGRIRQKGVVKIVLKTKI